jgi:hypothetical protein
VNIYAAPGTKVRFTNEGGYEYQRESALKHLVVGNVYTVAWTDVHQSSTDVFLVEVPKRPFNSVQFDDVE